MAPDALKEHLAVSGEKYTAYAAMKKKIEEYVADRAGIDDDDPMDINAVGEKGKPKGKGNDKAKWHKARDCGKMGKVKKGYEIKYCSRRPNAACKICCK